MQVVRKITGLSLRSQLAVNVRSLTSIVIMAVVVLIITPHVEMIRQGPIGLAIELGILICSGAATYLLTHVGLWIAQRRPDGPEREVFRVVAALRQQLAGA
jgi:hypothetical protein